MWHLIRRLVDVHFLIARWGYLMHSQVWYLLETFDMLIMMIDLYWLKILMPWFSSVFHWYIRLRHWHVGLLMIDLIALLSTLTLILPWLFWSLHMHTLTTVYHSTWHVDSLTCILFWSSLSMMIVSLSIWLSYSRLSCVYIDDISELCLIACCMTTLLCVIACRLSVWVAHLSPYLPLSSLGHFLHSGSRFCKCETFYVFALWPSRRLGVGSSDELYRCLGTF